MVLRAGYNGNQVLTKTREFLNCVRPSTTFRKVRERVNEIVMDVCVIDLEEAFRKICVFHANTKKSSGRLRTELEIRTRLDLLSEQWLDVR